MADEVQNATAPADVPARLDRADRLSFAITTLIALAVYLFTLAPELTLNWSGVMTTAAMYRGIGPPPGYPAWTLYSWLFIKLLPFSNAAWRVAVGAAVAGAAACGLVALIVSHSARLLRWIESPIIEPTTNLPKEFPLPEGEGQGEGEPRSMTKRRIVSVERFSPRERILIRIVCGSVAGLGLAFSGKFWHEAVIQQWWTFTVLLFVLVPYFLLRWITTGRPCFCWCAFLAYGLLLTDNQELMNGLPGLALAVLVIDPKLGRDVSIFVLPLAVFLNWLGGYPVWNSGLRNWPLIATSATALLLALVVVAVTRKIGSEWKSTLACAAFFLLGLAIYFYLPIASMTDPPMNWGYPRTVEGFLHVISRGQYERFNPTANWARFGMQLWGLLKQTGREFGWLYLVFAALPFCFLWRMNPIGRKYVLSLLPIFFCVGPLLSALLNPQLDRQSEDLIEPYFLALRVVLAVWAGIGLMLFAATTSRSAGFRNPAAA